MKKQLSIFERVVVTAFFTIATVALLLWEYTHDGVPTHYLLASDDMPGLSNWGGLILIPAFSWIVSGRIRQDTMVNESTEKRNILLRGIGFVIIGGIISYSFITNAESDIPVYVTGVLLILSFFLPIYKAECLIGYVLGSVIIFGTIIPVIAGCVLWTLFYLTYKGPRKLISLATKKKIQ